MDYMRKLYLLFFFSIYVNTIQSQTVTVSGECMTGSIVLSSIQDVNGKMAFGGMGTVGGFAGVQVNVYWMPAPDNCGYLLMMASPIFKTHVIPALPPVQEIFHVPGLQLVDRLAQEQVR